MCSERLVFLHSGKIHSRTAPRLDDKQKSLLRQSFASESTPTKGAFQKLSEQLGLKEATVYNWYQRERARTRKAKQQLSPKCTYMYMCVCVCACV